MARWRGTTTEFGGAFAMSKGARMRNGNPSPTYRYEHYDPRGA